MDTVLYVVFTLNGQFYGIEAAQTLEVLGFRPITPLPDQGSGVKGVISLRGAILPVFDLRTQFGLPAGEYSQFHVIIVVEVAGKRVGLIADEITDVVRILPEEMQEVESLPPGLPPNLIAGLGCKDDKLIVLLGIDGILDTGKS
ncbi:MAG: hypothetical protein A2521_14885 [Deltaproteobacteria bacterium RIFOXYD12_FULL_57_12]|nr:MAG: hypothetical protein A2521_14885 [Deltaproteobacteria bacterium RIFOXYD12_FULL_57_12]